MCLFQRNLKLGKITHRCTIKQVSSLPTHFHCAYVTTVNTRIDRASIVGAVERVAAALSRAVGRDLASRVAAGPVGALRLMTQPAWL